MITLKFFSKYAFVPYATIVQRYDLAGEFYFVCRSFCPFFAGDTQLPFGRVREITLQVSKAEFIDADIDEVILLNPSKIVVREYRDKGPLVVCVN
ncbi:MAG: hypothetical protein KBD54_01895 [Candidatus Pacebacteria bacterium]|jgi:hypothetical protein|nr:hypothetical protein [Candidatus Paceibacterota bacterium]